MPCRSWATTAVLGLDGATWSVLDPMRRRGLMPNLDALLSGASHGTLRSDYPAGDHGRLDHDDDRLRAGGHGVFDHRYYDAAFGRMKVNHSGRIRVPTVWHLISSTGRSIVSLNLPGLYPPINVKGIVVSGIDALHLQSAFSAAPEFAARLTQEYAGLRAGLLLEARPSNS